MKKLCLLILMFSSLYVMGQSSSTRYINEYKDLAIEHMNSNGVPASVILGISMHESGSGTSKIARYLNNHFGIKGKNNSTVIRSAYRGYDSVYDSYSDFIRAMKRMPKFAILFDKYSDSDYEGWVMGIYRGGYAESRTWAAQVLAIIRKYKLYEFDNRPSEIAVTSASKNAITQDQAPTATYLVKKGDTLNAIAKRYHTSVKSLMNKNSLNSSRLSIGQKLIL